jgi:hypothetical protein
VREKKRKKKRRAPFKKQATPRGIEQTPSAEAESPPESANGVQIFQYYQIAFASLYEEAGASIDAATKDARDARGVFWRTRLPSGEVSGEEGWSHLDAYLRILEARMETILQRHTHYYWVHLYRRIGVGLHPALDNSRDARTAGLVRNITEAAFVRYASLSTERRDIQHISEVAIQDIAGGFLLRNLERVSENAGAGRDSAVSFLVDQFKKSNQWVLVDFAEEEFVDIYRLEAIAYEYWLATAWMRRIGKGGSISISISDSGEVRRGEKGGDALNELLRHHDDRTAVELFTTSAIAIAFYPSVADRDLRGLAASYNASHLAFHDVCGLDEAKAYTFAPNFHFGVLELGAYARAHASVEGAFKAARGFSLRSLCGMVGAAAILEFSSAHDMPTQMERLIGITHLYQRAYVTNVRDGYLDALTFAGTTLMDSWLGPGNHDFPCEAARIFDFLSLRPEKQRGTGLWSLGPRYAFIEHGDALIVDLQGLVTILRSAFFGVRVTGRDKGVLFEEAFRAHAVAHGLDVLPQRSLKFASKVHREVDAAIRTEDTLFLCECRAMETPLDLEISRPKSVTSRIEDLDAKVSQARSLAALIVADPIGKNFDYSWARRVVPIVISPFVEWIWASSSDLWIDEKTPRILTPSEAIKFMGR